MITKEQYMIELLKEGIIKAEIFKGNILVTKTEPFQWGDYLSFYDAGRYLFHKKRFLWRAPSGEIIVGIGFAYEWKKEVEASWKNLLKNRMGTGKPMIFGGFPFDSKKKVTPLWEGFEGPRFVLPRFLLKKDGNGTYLTTNFVITPEDKLEDVIKGYEEDRAQLLEKTMVRIEVPAIIANEEIAPVEWKNTVDKVIASLKEGEAEKVVLAREWQLTLAKNCDSLAILERLLKQQHSSYVFSFETGEKCFVGATPERLMKKEGSTFTSMCLAGSIGKGTTAAENKERANQLLHDKKNLREHGFVVEMVRNVMEDICEEINIPAEPIILEMRNIFHLYTPVYGVAKGNESLLKIVKRLHPTPALGGFPQRKAMEMIRHFEQLDRGWYGAPIGWIDGEGNGEFAVAIRSGLINGEKVSLFAGCGVVKDSQAETEYEETKVKFTPMMSALGGESLYESH